MKRKLLYTILSVFCISNLSAQVGIHTDFPTSSLDVAYSGDNTIPDGIQVPRLTLKELTDKNASVYTNNQLSTIIYISDISGGDNLGSRINIKKIGHYYFDGTTWLLLDQDTNIFNSDGTILTNREVKLNGKTLSFIADGNVDNGMNIDGATGNIGIGKNPTTTERLVLSGGDNPLKIEGVKQGNIDTEKILAIDSEGIVKEIGTTHELLSNLSIPTPAVFNLTGGNIYNFLSGVFDGGGQIIPMKLLKNEIKGLTYNESTAIVTLPPGMYQIVLTYQALHNANCATSSYFFDFPPDSGGLVTETNRVRIHTTAEHTRGIQSSHGGSLSYIATLSNTASIPIRLGRGQSGDCYNAGMELISDSTLFLIYRLGD